MMDFLLHNSSAAVKRDTALVIPSGSSVLESMPD